MAKVRNHKITYAKRNELARRRGFKNYSEQRKATEFANESEMFEENVGKVSRTGKSREEYNEEVEYARVFYQAFKVDPEDYSATGAKAQWFVKIEGAMTYQEWAQHYPNGVREYKRLTSAA